MAGDALNSVLSTPASPAGTRFVAYFRVSTERQGRSGLGLDAQRDAVARHVASAVPTAISYWLKERRGRPGDDSRYA